MILSCYGIKKSFGDKPVLRDITFHINEHEKVAMIGNNGAGKTTLFHIIQKELDPDDGVISIKKDATVGYLAQVQNYNDDHTIMEELLSAKQDVIDMEQRIRSMEEEMKKITGEELDRLMQRYHETLHLFDLAGGYTYKSDILGILRGLNFPESDYEKSVLKLSGGERTRLSLGRILLTAPDLILLDEPTNYLDIASVTWLENYLINIKSAVLLVSHDRYFINRIVTKTVEIENGKSLMFDGNYEDFIVKKEVRKASLLSAYEKQQKEIKHQKEVIDTLRSFNREKSIKRADSRQHMLDKMEVIEKPVEEKIDMGLEFHLNKDSGNDVLSVSHIAKSYGERTLFNDVSFEIKKGEHVALIGANGTGKTNILKIINGVIPSDAGEVKLGSNVEIGYFDQQSAVLSDDKTVFEEISDTYPKMTETEIRNTMASFLFRGDEVFAKISTLSGGERGRVVLAKLMLSGANFLILDEPTNHLDMISKEILENVLNAYPGTLFYVSHDRYFINRTAERILCLENGNLTSYLGDYDYYVEKCAELQSSTQLNPASSFGSSSGSINSNNNSGLFNSGNDNSAAVSEGKADWQKSKAEQAAKRKLENQIKKIEEEISALEASLSDLEEKMNDPQIATNSVRLQKVCSEHAEKKNLLDEKMATWEELLLQQEE
ncbi:MAG: ABC-F family ATP-binding cassette domain-containing protein [Lachnospiraceae bacterium]|nr:ABC-F family ATP-binding cassette domain-containing protein [Lachnospiraceae bacterium]